MVKHTKRFVDPGYQSKTGTPLAAQQRFAGRPFWLVDQYALMRVQSLVLRLYNEDRMSGDERRDWANELNTLLDPKTGGHVIEPE